MTSKSVYFFISFIFLHIYSFAQISRTLKGVVLETFSKQPISSVHITAPDSKLEYITDLDGKFSITIPSEEKYLIFEAYQYRTEEIRIPPVDTLQVNLNFYSLFEFDYETDLSTRYLLKKVLSSKKFNDASREKNYSYDTYNKLTISSTSLNKAKTEMGKLFAFFSKKPSAMFNSQHLFLTESITKKNYLNSWNNLEKIKYSNTTGLNIPTGFNITSNYFPFSVFNNTIEIGSQRYISPLAGNPFKRYAFKAIDTINTKEGRVFVVKFNPIYTKRLELSKGLLFVDEKTGAISRWYAAPALQVMHEYKVWQLNEIQKSGKWFPIITKSEFNSSFGSLKVPYSVSNRNYIYNIQLYKDFNKKDFSEVVLVLDLDSNQKNDSIWDKNRREPFTEQDKNTFKFYDAVGKINKVDNYLNFGAKLAQGLFPLGRVDLNFSKAITINEYEGVRLGLGIQTNKKFSKEYFFGGYSGYGVRDLEWKYGLFGGYNFQNKRNESVELELKKDLVEPGYTLFEFDKKQYKSEALRRFRFPRFDRTKRIDIHFTSYPKQNLYTRLTFSRFLNQNLYSYRYAVDQRTTNFHFTEFGLSLRYSPGERFTSFLDGKFPVSNRLPDIWLQVIQGLDILGGEYNYRKYESKIQYNFSILGGGSSGIQLIAGYIPGKVPYMNLFNAKGSYRDFSFVIHNSFETMQYNEFLSNRYFHIFINHNFRKFRVADLNFKPYFSILHNMGWGSLKEPEIHKEIVFKTMEKGYYESGLFLNDFFVFNFGGLKIGIGAGLFTRYGSYALPQASNNLVFKFATNISF